MTGWELSASSGSCPRPAARQDRRVSQRVCRDIRDDTSRVREGTTAVDSIDELDMFEAERRLALYNEYRDAARVFTYYVETELRAYLANGVDVEPVSGPGGVYFRVTLTDVWIYEAERVNRFVPEAVIYSVNDVHVQKLKADEE
jgi:hypothetical protein